jgi:hypothetical protein
LESRRSQISKVNDFPDILTHAPSIANVERQWGKSPKQGSDGAYPAC